MPKSIPTWTYENRNQRTQRQSAQFQQLVSEIKPWVASGDYQTAQQIVQARVPEAAPKPQATPKKSGGGLLGGLKDLGSGLLDVGKEAGSLALKGLDVPANYTLRPLMGAATYLGAEQAVDPATGKTYRKAPSWSDIGSGLLDAATQNPITSYREGRQAWNERMADPGINAAGRVLLGGASDPLTYIGPGVASKALRIAPETMQASRALRIGAGLVESPTAASIGGVAGSTLAAGAADEAGLSPGWQTAATLAGGVVGGSLAGSKVGRNILAEGSGIGPMYREGAVPGAGMVMSKGAPKGTPVGEPYAGRPVIADSLTHQRDNTARGFGLAHGDEVAINDQLTLRRRMDGGYELADENSTIPITDSEDLSSLLGANSPLGLAATRAPQPLANDRLWFHSTRDMNYDLPDPDMAVGGQTGITQGPGIYMAADPSKSAGHYGPRTFATEFDGTTLDLTKPTTPADPIIEGGPSWQDLTSELEDRFRALAAEQPDEQFAQELVNIGANLRTSTLGDARAVRSYSDLASASARDRATNYTWRDDIAQFLDKVDREYNLPEETRAGLLGRFAGLPRGKDGFGLSVVNNILADSGVDALFHHSPRADGDVLIVLNGEKARVLGDVRNAPDVVRNGKTWPEMRDAASTRASSTADSGMLGGEEIPFAPNTTEVRDYAIGGGAGRALDAGIGDAIGSRGLRPDQWEAGMRPGEDLLKPRGLDQLGENYTAKDAMDVAADLGRQQSSVANALRSRGELAIRMLGKQDESGHLLEVPASVEDIAAGLEHPSGYDVLQNPGAYHLTPDQAEGVAQLHDIIKLVRQERESFGVGPNIKQIEGDGEFFPRLAKSDTKGNPLRPRGGGSRFGGGKDKSRIFETAREAEQAGTAYAPLIEALDHHVGVGLKLSADAHVKSLLERFGQTAADRMDDSLRESYQNAMKDVASIRGRLNTALRRAGVATSQGDELDRAIDDVRARVPTGAGAMARLPGIAEREGARAERLRTRPEDALSTQLGRRADTIDSVVAKFESAIPGDADRIRFLENAIERSQKRVDELRTRGGTYASTADQLQNDLAAAQTRLEQLRPQYQDAIERAKAVPPDRATVPQSIAPALIGRDFEPDVAKKIANFYGRNAPNPTTQVGKAKTVAQAVNTAVTPLKATMDASSIFNQQGRMATNHPLTFLKNVALSFHDLVDDTGYHEYMARPQTMRAARAGVAFLGEAGDRSEFQFGNWVERVPVFGELAKAANNHYVRFNNRMRGDIFDVITEANARMGQPFDARAEEQLAKSINRLTGVSTGRAGDLETLGMFAPNFFRSHLENLAHAFTDGSIEGQVARRYLGTFFAAGSTVIAGAALASGRDPSEVLNPLDMDALERGEVRLNPNFGTVRVQGQDVQMFGPYTSLFRLAAIGTDATVRSMTEQDATQLFDALGYAASTKGSPLAGFATDLIKGETFSGANPLSLSANIERFTPISISNAIAAHGQGLSWQEAAFDSIANAIGAQSNPMSPTERLDSLAMKASDPETGLPNRKGFYDSSPAVRKAIKDDNPTLWAQAVENGSKQRQQYEDAKEQVRQEQEADNQLLLSGKLTAQQWEQQQQNRRQQLIGQGKAIYTDKGGRVDTGDKVLDAFYRQIDASTVNGAPQWDAVYNWVDSLPEKDRAHIEANTGLNATPLERLKKQVASGYYSLPQYRGFTANEGQEINALLAEVNARAPGGNDVRQLVALRKLTTDGRWSEQAIKGARRAILHQIVEAKDRERYAKAHPELALETRKGTLTPADITAIRGALGRVA